MYTTSAHIHRATVERTCNELDVQPPDGYLLALADADRLNTALNALGGDNDVNAAVFAALLAGKDPAADKTVQRLLAIQQLQNNGIYRAAAEHTKRVEADAVTDNADDFTRRWADAVADDGQILRTTAQMDVFASVPNLGDMRPSQLVNAEHHKMWVSAATAARRLDAAANGFAALMAATGITYRPDQRALVLAPDLTLNDLRNVNRGLDTGQTPDAWTLARRSITPRLAGSLAEFVEAVGRISAEQADREEEARQIAANAGEYGPTPDQKRRYAELMEH